MWISLIRLQRAGVRKSDKFCFFCFVFLECEVVQ